MHLEGVDNALIADVAIGDEHDQGNLAGVRFVGLHMVAARSGRRIEHLAGHEFGDLEDIRIVIQMNLKAGKLILAGNIERYLDVLAGLCLFGGLNEDIRVHVLGGIAHSRCIEDLNVGRLHGVRNVFSDRGSRRHINEIAWGFDVRRERIVSGLRIGFRLKGCGEDDSLGGERCAREAQVAEINGS